MNFHSYKAHFRWQNILTAFFLKPVLKIRDSSHPFGMTKSLNTIVDTHSVISVHLLTPWLVLFANNLIRLYRVVTPRQLYGIIS